jgi:hypothetical protein
MRHQKERKQMNRNNQINTDHLKTADLSVQDLRDIITLLEAATAHLIVPLEVTAALTRLQRLVERKP